MLWPRWAREERERLLDWVAKNPAKQRHRTLSVPGIDFNYGYGDFRGNGVYDGNAAEEGRGNTYMSTRNRSMTHDEEEKLAVRLHGQKNVDLIKKEGLEKLANVLSGGKFLKPNFSKPVVADNGKKFKLVDGLSVAQGPNYALAKRMQHWRAQIEFEAGAVVSSMVAPSTLP